MVEDSKLFEPVPQEGSEQPSAMEGVVEIAEAAVPEAAEDQALKGSYEWRIEKWSQQLEGKLYSDNFEIGTHLWRLLVCPKGMNQNTHLSMYLDSPEAAFAPPALNPSASFKLTLLNQLDRAQDFFKESSHKWSAAETDWGFTNFITLEELAQPDRGFLVDDTLIIRVDVTVQRELRYTDSRRVTGCVGLKNQGATCYMNSLLQCLYHLPYFRKAVYHMPTREDEQPGDSLPLALQSLFFKLQYGAAPPSTKDLTRSFGWSSLEAFQQHDVQELNRVLCEKLEEKMKGTRVEKVINELFEGTTHNFITCMNVDYSSTRRESFMDLQLDVKGCSNIYDSFDRYTEVEVMSGENQYKAEGHGLQDARKGVLFESLPPVLQLQLKRFEYDFARDTMVKINDRYEFFDTLDLDHNNGRYLAPGADRSVRNLYRLHSVLVHSGGVHGGHYYAYIRPDGRRWIKFDDTAVTLEDSARALDEQFGGEDEGPVGRGGSTGLVGSDMAGGGTLQPGGGTGLQGKRTGSLRFTKFSNAYMLVYVREADWDRVMCNVDTTHIEPLLLQRLEAERAEKERRQQEKREAHLYCNVRVATDADMAEQVGSTTWFDLVDYDRLAPAATFRVRKLMRFSELKQQVEAALGVPVSQQRYWAWQVRQNKTVRPTTRLKDDDKTIILDLKEYRDTGASVAKRALMDLRLYLETPWPPGTELKPSRANDITLFFKYYDPWSETLRYVGHKYVPRSIKVRDLFPAMARLAGLPQDTPLTVFEEIKWEPTVMVSLLPPNQVLHPAAQLETGDIICFQHAVPQDVAQAAADAAGNGEGSGASGGGGAAQAPLGGSAGRMEVETDELPTPEGDVAEAAAEPAQPQQQQASRLGRLRATVARREGAKQQQQQQQQEEETATPGTQPQPAAGQQVQQGDILTCRYPCAPSFLAYVRNRRQVTFKRLDAPKGEGLCLELLREQDYDAVTAALAARLGLPDPDVLRLTQHNAYTGLPQRVPIRHRGIPTLAGMLTHAGHALDVVYYEVLDMPLPALELLKTMRIQYHNQRAEFVAEHTIRLRRDSTVADALTELRRVLPEDQRDVPLRLIELDNSRIYKVYEPSECIDTINEAYWLIRVEPLAPEDTTPLAPGDRVIHVCHINPPRSGPVTAAAAAAAAANGGAPAPMPLPVPPPLSATSVVTYGDPLLLRIGAAEPLSSVLERLRSRLGVPEADFAAWRPAFVSLRASEYLSGMNEPLAPRFAAAEAVGGAAADAGFLALEHEPAQAGAGSRRPGGRSTTAAERAVKIYN